MTTSNNQNWWTTWVTLPSFSVQGRCAAFHTPQPIIFFIFIFHYIIKLVEGVGVEPTYPVLQTGASTVTANLPLKIFFFMSRRNIRNYLHIVNRFIRYLLKYLIDFLTLCKNWWARKDLNFQNPKTPDLQSGPLPVTGYLPIIKSLYKLLMELNHNCRSFSRKDITQYLQEFIKSLYIKSC